MRFRGHPVHLMLIHFPVALWPAHFALQVFAGHLPAGVGAIAGFWLLAVGVALGWGAAACGAMDLLAIARVEDDPRRRPAWIHASINGATLAAFTGLVAMEYVRYPAIHHGAGFLVVEAALLAALFVGNYFGGEVAWRPGSAAGESGH